MALTIEDIQNRGRCNWCLNPLNTADGISESNFVDTGKKLHNADSANATAVFCNDCLASEFRTGQPKSAIDMNTMDEVSIDQLV